MKYYSIQEITRISKGDKDIMYELTIKNIGLFNTIEESLIGYNRFRYYKDSVCLMTDDEAIDIFKGVIFIPRRGGFLWDSVQILFEDLYDWHRLDFAYKRIKNIMEHEDPDIKTAISIFIAGKDIRGYIDLLKVLGIID